MTKTVGGARPFEQRAKEFEEKIKPISESLGVIPWAAIQPEPDAIRAIPVLRDLWPSKE